MRDENGQNTFADDSDPDGLSALARQCIAGLVNDHVSMTALVASTVNGYYANWGFDHRGVAVRVPPSRRPGTRLEHRLADGSPRSSWPPPHVSSARCEVSR